VLFIYLNFIALPLKLWLTTMLQLAVTSEFYGTADKNPSKLTNFMTANGSGSRVWKYAEMYSMKLSN